MRFYHFLYAQNLGQLMEKQDNNFFRDTSRCTI